MINSERLQESEVQEPYELEISNQFETLISIIEEAESENGIRQVYSTIKNTVGHIIVFDLDDE